MTMPPLPDDELAPEGLEYLLASEEAGIMAGEDPFLGAELPIEEDDEAGELESLEDAKAEAEEAAQERTDALRAAYGSDFPQAKEGEATDDDWVDWVKGRWEAHRAGVQDAIFDAQANRLFRSGVQWISSTANRGAWREPPMPRDSVRAVDNQVGPALDWALQVMSEQRPGFRFSPTNPDPDRQRKAQAMQLATEYQYYRLDMRRQLMEAEYWAQTDGCSFLLSFWDTEAGAWEEMVEGQGARPLGDVGTKVYRIEQVRVSAEATANQKPMYWLLRDVMPLAQAVALYGPDVADETDEQFAGEGSFQTDVSRYTQSPLLQDQRTVDRYTLFCDRSAYLPEGLTVVTVGKKLVFGPSPLVCGRVPVVRVTDGSTDPSFFPRARMSEWRAPQMRINMVLSKWIESVRRNAGGMFVSKTGAIVGETFVGGGNSVIEVRGAAPLGETLMQMNGFSLGNDAKELLQRELKTLEALTGWTEQARGSFSSSQSGRAVLAIREQLERAFAPLVYAVSDAMAQWAECVVAWMRWGYQMPRLIGVIGGNRPDLAREFSSIDFDQVVDVRVDPETLMPMPRTLRLFLLDQDLEKGIIDPKEYRRRRPMAYLTDGSSADDVQEAKGKRVAEQIRLRQEPEAMVWQDNEAVHQDILEQDIILAGDIEPDVREAAQARWSALAEQAAQKMGPPAPQEGAAPEQGPVQEGTPLPPEQAPTFGSSPSIATAPVATQDEMFAPDAAPQMI